MMDFLWKAIELIQNAIRLIDQQTISRIIYDKGTAFSKHKTIQNENPIININNHESQINFDLLPEYSISRLKPNTGFTENRQIVVMLES